MHLKPSRMLYAVLSFSLFLVACVTDAPEDGADTTPVSTSGLTYYGDIEPILAEECYTCHREDGAGPFRVDLLDDVLPRAELIQLYVESRKMPPFLADNSGDCNTYHDARWLSDEDISKITRWVADPARPLGEASGALTFKADIAHLEAPTLLERSEPYTPDNSLREDDYRCFLSDPGITTKKYITAYEVLVDNPQFVHHVIVYNPETPEAVQDAMALDAAEDGPGFACFGGPRVDATVAAAWAPGRNIWRYPAGTGIPLEPGIQQIIQVHYHLEGDSQPDQTKVAFELVDSVDSELLAWFYANTEMALQPGVKEAESYFDFSPEAYFKEVAYNAPGWATEDMTLVGIAPHMHVLGSKERGELLKSDGSTECLIDVPRWDFDWQFAYFFEKPVKINHNDIISMNCTHDTRTQTNTVYWGDGTEDEMCLLLMYSTFEGGKIPPRYGTEGTTP